MGNHKLHDKVQIEIRPDIKGFSCSDLDYDLCLRCPLYHLDSLFGVYAKWGDLFESLHSTITSIGDSLRASIYYTCQLLPKCECDLVTQSKAQTINDLNHSNLLSSTLSEGSHLTIMQTVPDDLYYNFSGALWNSIVLRRSVYSFVIRYLELLSQLTKNCKALLHQYFPDEREVLKYLKWSHLQYKTFLVDWKAKAERDNILIIRNRHIHESLLSAFNIRPTKSFGHLNLYFKHYPSKREDAITVASLNNGLESLKLAICDLASQIKGQFSKELNDLGISNVKLSDNTVGLRND